MPSNSSSQLEAKLWTGNLFTCGKKMELSYSMLQAQQPNLGQHLTPYQHPNPYAHYPSIIPLWPCQPFWNPMSIQTSYSSYVICVPVSSHSVPEEFPTVEFPAQLTPHENELSGYSLRESSGQHLLDTADYGVGPPAIESEEIVAINESPCQVFHNRETLPVCNPLGNIQWLLKKGINVEVSNHGSFLISCNKIVLVVGLNGKSLVMLHPSARVWYHREKVHVTMLTNNGYRRQVKIWHKGVSFSANPLSVAYLLDIAGVRTSIEQFRNINGSTIRSVFEDSQEAVEVDMPSICVRPGHWLFGEYAVEQREDGTTRVFNEEKNIELRLCPLSGTLQVRSPFLYLTASSTSSGRGRHVYVRRIQVGKYHESSSRRMHFNGEHLVVRDGGQEAAIDINGKLRVEREASQTCNPTSPKAA